VLSNVNAPDLLIELNVWARPPLERWSEDEDPWFFRQFSGKTLESTRLPEVRLVELGQGSELVI
jgi:hypothetical protein